jgi:hypothetical protein
MARCQRHSASGAQRWEQWTCSGCSLRRIGIAHLLGVDAEPSITIVASPDYSCGRLPMVGTQRDRDVACQAEMVSCDDAISSGFVL